MYHLSNEVISRYESILKKREVPIASFMDYKKWLRYFHDFCAKHPVPESNSEQVRLFIEKLRGKKQTEAQCRQAAHAISIFFEMQRCETSSEKPDDETEPQQCTLAAPAHLPLITVSQRKSQFSVAGYAEKTDSPEWDVVLESLAGEIKVRHYSRKTLKTYAQWARKFQRFLQNKPPQELSTSDVMEYLTYLAVKCNVAASTQNQAFNSLLFLFRHALKREFGELRDVPRAKKSLYIPMVLSRAEIDAILKQLSSPFNLVVSMLFGCGLRLFEDCNCGCGISILTTVYLRCTAKGKRTGPCHSRRRLWRS